MIRLSACVEMIYRDLPMVERIAHVAAMGLPAFEFWSWVNKDLPEIARAKAEHRLAVSSFAYASPGAIVDPANHAAFLKHFDGVLTAADTLDCRTVIVTVGQQLPAVGRADQHAAIVDALRALAPRAQQNGISIVVEPLNTLINHKGYYLSTSEESFQIIDEVGSPAISILFDVYHQQITEGNLINNITTYFQKIGHFHIADNPGRNEPGTGEINYANVLRTIDSLGYSGYIGLEYRPKADADAALQATKVIAGMA
ncbi:MAG: hydroxypyruvate isomerase family protein [Chloroflexota bacterium]